MDIFSPPTPSDPGAFLIEQTPAYIKNLVALRDELALRQGALSAVENTANLQAEAQRVLDAAREEARTLLADAVAKLRDAKARDDELSAKAARLEADRATFEQQQITESRAAAERAMALLARETDAETREAALAADEAAVRAAQVELDEKVRAVQAKVAALAL